MPGSRQSMQSIPDSIFHDFPDTIILNGLVVMLDHPITVLDLLIFFHTCKSTGLKVYKFMGMIQNQEEHIGHVKQPKSDVFQDRLFLYQAKYGCTQILPENENLTLTVVLMYCYVISLCTFCIDKNHQTKA